GVVRGDPGRRPESLGASAAPAAPGGGLHGGSHSDFPPPPRPLRSAAERHLGLVHPVRRAAAHPRVLPVALPTPAPRSSGTTAAALVLLFARAGRRLGRVWRWLTRGSRRLQCVLAVAARCLPWP